MEKMNRFRGLLLVFAVIGPGIITSMVDNDAGGIATYSIAGATFGYSLLWTLIPITILLILIQEMVARMGVVTGKGLADLIREEYGVKITFLVMVGLFFANLTTTIAEFAGIVAAGEIFGVSKYMIVPFCVVTILFFVLKSSYRTVEKVFLVLIVFYAAYIFSGVMSQPDWGQVAKHTLIPTVQMSSSYLILLVAVVGTSVTPWMQFYLQSSVVEKGIKIEHYRITRFDIIFGSIVTSIVAFFIIVATASTMFENSIPVNDAKDVALALAPLAGQWAAIMFAIGLFIAAFLGAWIVPLSTAYFVTEGIGFESGLNKSIKEAPQFYFLLASTIVAGAVIILLPNVSLVPMIIFAQVVNALLLPIVFMMVINLSSDKRIMKGHENSRFIRRVANFILGCLFLMGIVLIYSALT